MKFFIKLVICGMLFFPVLVKAQCNIDPTLIPFIQDTVELTYNVSHECTNCGLDPYQQKMVFTSVSSDLKYFETNHFDMYASNSSGFNIYEALLFGEQGIFGVSNFESNQKVYLDTISTLVLYNTNNDFSFVSKHRFLDSIDVSSTYEYNVELAGCSFDSLLVTTSSNWRPFNKTYFHPQLGILKDERLAWEVDNDWVLELPSVITALPEGENSNAVLLRTEYSTLQGRAIKREMISGEVVIKVEVYENTEGIYTKRTKEFIY